MKKLIVWSVASLMTLLVLVQCKSNNENYEPIQKVENTNLHQVTVKEVLNATAYTYLFVAEGEKEYWMAIPLTDIEVGKTYTYEGGMEMKNFESKDLNRTFESVYFVENLIDSDAPVKTEPKTTEDPHGMTKKVEVGETSTKLMDGVTLAKGAISLHDLFSGKDKLAGKTVILTGKVVKFNPDIMFKNWIHLQDGTSFKGLNDILITTLAKINVDEIVTLKGTVFLNKDLGAGYKYDILIEDAVIVK
ncbi:MAG: hypothetical protein Q8J84_10695 [Flavobacteriaceae bacterium]|nr:hypothetical protein [Flavobacteriaceae bacterium]